MRIHVAKTASSCFCALRQIRSIRRTVSKSVILSHVVAMVLARLDYGNATQGLPDLLLRKRQSVLNAAARLVCSGRKYLRPRYTPLLRDLYWLPFLERITFRLAVLAYRRQHSLRHRLICQLIFTASRMPTPVGDFDPHRRQRCSFHARDSR